MTDLQLLNLKIGNFKNISEAKLDFAPKLNCFTGNNGMGKSNLLDAVYYLSYCRSFYRLTDSQTVKNGEEVMFLEGRYLRRETDEKISGAWREGGRKIFRRNDKEYPRLSDHLGFLPLVMVAPADMELIEGYGESRRRYIDMLAGQADTEYMTALLGYNRALEQRNAMLRARNSDAILFEAVEMKMASAAQYIIRVRRRMIEDVSSIFRECYGQISGTDEIVSAVYEPDIKEDSFESIMTQFESGRSRDMILKHTSSGPHRDEIALEINGMNARKSASQGQSKTFIVALKFAQYYLLAQATGLKPLLLLDDIFDKLDSHRVSNIINIVSGPEFGQIFITDTGTERIAKLCADSDSRHYNVANGSFALLK